MNKYKDRAWEKESESGRERSQADQGGLKLEETAEKLEDRQYTSTNERKTCWKTTWKDTHIWCTPTWLTWSFSARRFLDSLLASPNWRCNCLAGKVREIWGAQRVGNEKSFEKKHTICSKLNTKFHHYNIIFTVFFEAVNPCTLWCSTRFTWSLEPRKSAASLLASSNSRLNWFTETKKEEKKRNGK